MKNKIKARITVPLLVAAITMAIILSTLTLTGCENPAGDTGKTPTIATPIITKQPQDRLYFIGETIEPLEVAGESPDGGIISYQWYSNATASNSGGTAIPGATNAVYMPTISNSAVNNYYYYAVVTNTNDNIQGTKTSSTASRSVRISVASSAEGEQAANVYMTIPNPNLPANRFQYIRGYGGMDVAWENFPPTTQADTELMYNPDKLGYNILRIMIRPENIDPAKTIAELVAKHRPDYYENVKIVNKYGGYVLASPWTPPKEWKSNNSINGVTADGQVGYLLPQYYPQYAQYLREFARNMYDNGAPIYAISIAHEPDDTVSYDGCKWKPEEMRDFFVQQGRFTDGVHGYGGGKEISSVLIMNGESAYTPYINLAALQNQQSKAAIDILGRHYYLNNKRSESLWNDYPDLLQKGELNGINKGRMEVWMTDHYITSGMDTRKDSTWPYVWYFLNDIDMVIRLNNENAFVWWSGKRCYSMIGDGLYGTTDGAILPRGWALSHYARFTIGMTRIQINTDTTRSVMKDGTPITHVGQSDSVLNNIQKELNNVAMRVTAFTSEDGNEISLIMWAPTDSIGSNGYDPGVIEVTLPPGFTANGVMAFKTNGIQADQIFQPYDIKISGDRTKAYITLEKSEIVSVKFSK